MYIVNHIILSETGSGLRDDGRASRRVSLTQTLSSATTPHANMQLTFVTDLGHSFVVEIDPNMELENVMALLEAEVGVSRCDSGDPTDVRHDSLAFRYPSRAFPTRVAS